MNKINLVMFFVFFNGLNGLEKGTPATPTTTPEATPKEPLSPNANTSSSVDATFTGEFEDINSPSNEASEKTKNEENAKKERLRAYLISAEATKTPAAKK